MNNLSAEVELNTLSNTVVEKIQDIESAIVKAEIFEQRRSLEEIDCREHLVNAELEFKGSKSSFADENN